MRPLTEPTSKQTRTAADPAADAARRETSGQAALLLNELPENQREVIRLRIEHDLSYREISHITGLSESNVGFLLHVGLRTLRERLAGSLA